MCKNSKRDGYFQISHLEKFCIYAWKVNQQVNILKISNRNNKYSWISKELDLQIPYCSYTPLNIHINLHIDAHTHIHTQHQISHTSTHSSLACSCLENRRAGGAWWAAVCGVSQSQTRLKRLSSSSSSSSSISHYLSLHILTFTYTLPPSLLLKI